MRIGIIGCGSIGTTLIEPLEQMDEVTGIALLDSTHEQCVELARDREKVHATRNLSEMLELVDVVVEAASQRAVFEFAEKIVLDGKDLLIMSIGALADDEFRERLFNHSNDARSGRIFLPSGAVAGVDAILSASGAAISSVELTSVKPPASLQDAARTVGMDLTGLKGQTVLFEGSARESIKLFPKNVNVAALVSLAGIGFDATSVKVIADPKTTRNTHTLVVKGDFGEMETHICNLPFPDNPRTSYLAALSALSAIKGIVLGVMIGV